MGCTAASLTMDPEEVDQVDMEVCGVCSDQVEVCVCVVTRWRCVCVCSDQVEVCVCGDV